MTLRELNERMTSEEFELWMAEFSLRAEECPFCGTHPEDIGEFEYLKLTCTTCRNDYSRTRKGS